jgi:ADP-ribosylglycohydrolase/Periplasmic binding protein-like domain
MAIGAMDAVREAGLAIPQDIAIMGFDDIDAASLVTPALTTVLNPAYEMGVIAGRLLLERITGEYEGERRCITVPQRIIERDSDIWGYVSPGDPERAARLAFQDASLSHVKNGIYGEMWAAALMAASFVAQGSRHALEAALAQIPRQSRLAEALHDVFALYDRGLDWEQARDDIEPRYYAKYSFVHTVQNAVLVAMALLWGAGDYTRTIGLAVQGGWDTDCNGATAGSAFGVLHGTRGLPGRWIDPLHDFIRSSVSGYDNSRISDLAERTLPFALASIQASRKE